MYRKQYDPPANYGVPNPYGPRTHNWRGGPYNEGSLFHGPVYTRPGYKMPWMQRPLNGLGQDEPELQVPLSECQHRTLNGATLGFVVGVALVFGIDMWWDRRGSK